jgi:uncharacterized membrane protein YphA (DoxX/SURF4 family)
LPISLAGQPPLAQPPAATMANFLTAIDTIGLTADGPQFGPPGYEVNLLYIASLLALILGGAGPFSIDRLLARRKREPAASPC